MYKSLKYIIMESIEKLKDFLSDDNSETRLEQDVVNIKSKDGLIERKVINKKIIVEDGRQLLKEELPVSNMK